MFLLAVVAFTHFELSPLPLVPWPAHVEARTGTFNLSASTVLVAEGREARENADYLRKTLRFAGLPLMGASKPTTNAIVLRVVKPEVTLGAEGYRLSVGNSEVDIEAATSAGLFYGIQTFRQLLPPNVYGTSALRDFPAAIPGVEIVDSPRFGWRGMMLDVSRHFFPKEEIMKLLGTMAVHKLNRFHWHLTDEPGWRIEIKRYPNLTKLGSLQNYDTFGKPIDGQNHGGFYTQKDIREVVAYAKKLHITIVPEIEMPGHSVAAIASYHELGVWNNPPKANPWSVESSNLNTEDSTIRFYENVLDEVMKLFPSTWIHVGGDEVDKGPWKRNPRTQELKKQRNLKDEDELQSWFMRQIDTYLTAHGRRMIGWDEILEGGLAKGGTVMSWRGIEGGIAAARAGHDAVMSPTSHMYFDFYQGDSKTEPRAIGGFLPLDRVYSYEPIPSALNSSEATHILGVQANIWAEYIPTSSHMEYMAWPRGCALSEVAWSPKEARNWSSFTARLRGDLLRFDCEQMNYRKLTNSVPTGISDR
jgi:hexosaminidase